MAEQAMGEIDKDRETEKNRRTRRQDSDWGGTTAGMSGETIGDATTSTVEQVGTMMDQAWDQGRQIAGDALYQQGTRAGEY